ncbi:MAG: TRAP transporter substrate-binding protein [Deltaproteobacteria bacterium]|nr:TRAP transporter substrate-binding protein [Deltaproteobacteria bacterium]
MSVRTKSFIVASLCCGLSLLVSRPPVASAAENIKITTVQLKQQQMGVGIDRLAKYINEQLPGKVSVKTYPAAQLYTGQEETQALMKGEIEMAYVIGSALDLLDPAMQLTKLPYMAPTIEAAYGLWDGSVGKKLTAKMEKKGIALLGVVSSGSVAVSNSKHPIRKVEDFKGLKMRSFGPMGASTLKGLGAMSVVTASEETYSALQQGVIDGATTPANVFLLRKYYDVQKYVTDPGMLNATFGYIIANNDWWTKLAPDVRKGIQTAIERVVREQRAEIAQSDKSVFEQIAAKGCQVITLTPAEEAAWKKALQNVYTEFSAQIGPDLIKEAEGEVERFAKAQAAPAAPAAPAPAAKKK